MSEPIAHDITQRIAVIRERLLRWYGVHQRKLPWRAAATGPGRGYGTLVSEFMLQQTQVATVIPYFLRFIEAFPTVRALAEAEEQQVLRLWQGLGYYRRARHLHAAARQIVRDFDGRVPATVDELLELPGVGRYTAGAIASIAFGTRAPILDGNVMRVLARLEYLDDPVDQPATQRRLWELAESLLPLEGEGDSGELNQAVMELGALVCTPIGPRCLFCPVAEHCEGYAAGVQERLPIKSPKKPRPTRVHDVLAIYRGGKFLFEQRPATGLWAGMWQLPTHEAVEATPPDRLRTWAAERFGLTVVELPQIGTFDRGTTHRAITWRVWDAPVTDGRLRPRTGIWRQLHQLDDLPLPKPQLEAIKFLRA